MTVIQFPHAPALSTSAAHDLLLETLRAATGQLSHAGKALLQCESEASARVEAAGHLVAYPYLAPRRGESYDDLYRISARTRPAFERVLPYRPELSYLLTHPPDPSLADLLTAGERRTITEWIREGARDN